MAISDILPGIEVVVNVNGDAAKEYADPDANESGEDDEIQILATAAIETRSVELQAKYCPHIIKYIEAKTGAPFEIEVIAHENFRRASHHIGMEVQVDA